MVRLALPAYIFFCVFLNSWLHGFNLKIIKDNYFLQFRLFPQFQVFFLRILNCLWSSIDLYVKVTSLVIQTRDGHVKLLSRGASSIDSSVHTSYILYKHLWSSVQRSFLLQSEIKGSVSDATTIHGHVCGADRSTSVWRWHHEPILGLMPTTSLLQGNTNRWDSVNYVTWWKDGRGRGGPRQINLEGVAVAVPEKYMSLNETTKTFYVCRCLLCNPRKKLLLTSKTSHTNLRTHIQVIPEKS